MNRALLAVDVRVLSLFLGVLLLAGSAMAHSTEVVGTGHADIDIPAVQAAVDQGGAVTLRGRFSFDQPPTVLTALAGMQYPAATIRISKSVAISGVGRDRDDLTEIEGGTIPFYVEAPGADVSIRALRFEHPIAEAILVYSAAGLTITSCKIDGIVPSSALGGSIAIDIDTSGAVPTPGQPGHPENISGRVLIADNDIDVSGGSVADNTLGITVFSVGESPNREADLFISGNRISNTTEPAINFRRIGGRAHIEGNVIHTGPISSQKAPRPEVIRVVNTGSYVVTHNSIECEWPDPEAIGIGVFSQFSAWPMEHAVVLDNDVIMSPPAGTVFGNFSAGIDVRGFTRENVIANNRIRGRARAAIAIDVFKGGTPTNNALLLNEVDDFEGVPVSFGQGVTDTLVLGQQRIAENHKIASGTR
ncbi:MAG: right-handed parallel beta-helix repeat-containing protein [Acidobacteria bacterium]|nr:right-handed parallel beta-helix repeat-containing protein [Acidobacteriota bacterium]MBV9436291.1 right-handed parallel beta-helix repeat-containing protein [Acidobacteriota bacterium]